MFGFILIGLILGVICLAGWFLWNHPFKDHSARTEEDEVRRVSVVAEFQKKKKIILIVSWCALMALLLLFKSLCIVKTSHVGVVTLFGSVQPTTLPEGMHFIHPFANVNSVFTGTDVASAKSAEGGSKDLQIVHTTLTANYHVDANKALALYRLNPSLGYEDSYIVPAIYESFKAVTALYTAEELVTKRPAVSAEIKDTLQRKLTSFGIVVDGVNIIDFSFSKVFNSAIEAKVMVTQQAEAAHRELEKTEYEAQSKIISAKAQAETIRIQAEAVQKAGGKEFIQLEAIKKWDGKLPGFIGNGAPMPFIDVQK